MIFIGGGELSADLSLRALRTTFYLYACSVRAREQFSPWHPLVSAQAAYSCTASYSARMLAVEVLGWRLWQGATT